MRKIYSLLTIIALVIFTTKTHAADILVEEFGISPAYPSITTAVAAAIDGDRIIIKNRSGNIPWIENITVDKSLEFLSYDNDSLFIVQGVYTIVLNSNRTVTIIGMNNLSGGITYSGSSNVQSTIVNILDCSFTTGNINLNHPGVKVNCSGSSLFDGSLAFVFGNIIGNDITYIGSGAALYCYTATGYINDTVFVIGNKITHNNSFNAVEIQNSASVCYIKNNYIRHKSYGLYFAGCANVSIANYIYNNTIVGTTGSPSAFGVFIANIPASGIVEIMNNVIDDNYSGTSYGVYRSSGVTGQVNVYYNHISSSVSVPISTGFTFIGNNQTNVPIVLAADGTIISGTPINGGNPAAPFYDLDLSAGDAGAYGGSFTLNNFFPLHLGPARVYFVNYPFNVRQGSTLNVKANAYDR